MRKIASELVPHSVAEEKVVYNMVIALPDRAAQVDGYEGTLEHEWASKTLERLAAIEDASSAEHKATAKVLRELVEHHIREEEENIWRDVRKHCSHEDRARMDCALFRRKATCQVTRTRLKGFFLQALGSSADGTSFASHIQCRPRRFKEVL